MRYRVRPGQVAVVVVVILAGVGASSGSSAAPCDRSVSYFVCSPSPCQWRVFDPVSGTDTLFLPLGSLPTTVLWDSTFARVTYRMGRQIDQVDWRLGAKPRTVAVLPEIPDICGWWFNPDSSRWQLFTSRPIVPAARRDLQSPPYFTQLWQATRDGRRWHVLASDTAGEEIDEPCDCIPHSSAARQMVMLTGRNLAAVLGVERAELASEPNDSLVVERYFARSLADSNRGMEFGVVWGDIEAHTFAPIYLVDRASGARQLLCGPETPETRMPGFSAEVFEACRFLLITCDYVIWRLVDVATGRDLPFGSRVQALVTWAPSLRSSRSP